ncbi:hypothetical protein [Nocardia jejuensis]|uniref:hypothetical protein n=1 Tax=Nocardia jejuensis TaxID=328049 RepID=UPI000AC92E9F|nr:hypothetical protein [Nocardia jejuensis]
MNAVRLAAVLAGLLMAFAVPSAAHADPVSCTGTLDACVATCQQRYPDLPIHIGGCSDSKTGWYCTTCYYNTAA